MVRVGAVGADAGADPAEEEDKENGGKLKGTSASACGEQRGEALAFGAAEVRCGEECGDDGGGAEGAGGEGGEAERERDRHAGRGGEAGEAG